MVEEDNVYNLEEHASFVGTIIPNENNINKEERGMSKDNLVYEKDLKNLEDKQDLKLKNIEDKLTSEISLAKIEISSDIRALKSDLEIMINNKSKEEEKERKKENREAIRTTLTGVTVIIAFTGLLLKIFFGI